jgi:RhoGEF domain
MPKFGGGKGEQKEKTDSIGGSSAAKAAANAEMLAKRARVAQELIETEQSYVASLRACHEFFLAPLRRERQALMGGKGTMKAKERKELKKNSSLTKQGKHALCSEDEERVIFSIWETLKTLHEALLEALTAAPDATQFGAVFLDHADFLKTYTTYVNNYNDAMQVLAAKRARSPQFEEWLNSAHLQTPGRADLTSFLIMPVQRLPRCKGFPILVF